MAGTSARWIGLLGAVAFALASCAAVAAPDASAAKKRVKKPSCVRAQVAGKRVCLRRGARCDRFKRSAYLEAGFDCVKRGRKRVLVRAKPSAVRQGRYVALPSSGEPTFRQALAAFDTTIAPLPGVRTPPGTVGETASGSSALRWLYDVRDRLTPAQLDVLKRVLVPGPGAQTVDIDPEGNVFLSAGGPLDGTSGARAAGQNMRFRALVDDAKSVVPEAVARLKAKGVIVGHPVTVSSIEGSLTPEGKAAPLADAFPLWLRPLALQGNVCRVRLFPQKLGDNPSLPILRRALLHELTHCAQFEFMSSSGQVGTFPGWVLDGTAEYVAAEISQEWNGDGLDIGAWWPKWLRSSKPGLFTRTYDGIGFWELLATGGTNVYGLIGPLIRAGSSLGAYNVALSGANPQYKYRWGTTLAMIPRFGADWNLKAPGARPPAVPTRNIADGASWESTISAKGADVIQLNISADVVHVFSSSPDVEGLLRDSAGVDHILQQQLDYCARPDACDCADAPDPPEASFPKLPQGTSYLGYANQQQGMSLKVTGEKLECDDTKKPGGGGGGGGGGGPGLQIRELLPTDEGPVDEPRLLGTIKTGKCKFTRAGFSATGKGGGFRFSLRVAGARTPGQYQIIRGSDSTYLRVSGAGGPYDSSGPAGQGNGGVVIKREVRTKRVGKKVVKVTGYRLSAGMTPLYGSGKKGVAVIPGPGGLKC